MSDVPEKTRYSSLTLKDIVCLCAGTHDNEAWEEFLFRIRKPLGIVIARTASLWSQPSRSLVEDLIQITYLKLWEGGRHLLRDFAIEQPEAILAYLRKTAVNATHDYFKHGHSQASGGGEPHVSTNDVDPESGNDVDGNQERITIAILLKEVDEYLRRSLTGPTQERDRTIFWLYFRQGMTTKEIASLPTISLSAKGVGSVIERLKHCIREQILSNPNENESEASSEENS
jgi:RNA polymerase sigma-70 factor (ECF subfamily)